MAREERGLEGVEDGTALHVLADRQSEEGQDCRRDVEHRSLAHLMAFAEWRPCEHDDAVLPMPVGGLSITNARIGERAILAGPEAVIGAHNDGRLRSSHLHQAAD